MKSRLVSEGTDERGAFIVWSCADGTPFWIDAADRPLVERRHFFVNRGPSVYGRYVGATRSSGGTDLLHRILMNCPKGLTVDHIDANPFNNRRHNLRICTAAQNRMNKHNFKRTASGFRGVYQTASGRWQAIISIDHKATYIGRFDTPEMAAREWDKWAARIRGEFAQFNFPEDARHEGMG